MSGTRRRGNGRAGRGGFVLATVAILLLYGCVSPDGPEANRPGFDLLIIEPHRLTDTGSGRLQVFLEARLVDGPVRGLVKRAPARPLGDGLWSAPPEALADLLASPAISVVSAPSLVVDEGTEGQIEVGDRVSGQGFGLNLTATLPREGEIRIAYRGSEWAAGHELVAVHGVADVPEGRLLVVEAVR